MLAKGTPIWIISIPILSLISLLVHFWLQTQYFLILASVLLLIFIPILAFFRDPDRAIGEGVVSPADGKIRDIKVEGGWLFISIFMNVHNVHVNRMPSDGRILSLEHIDGGFVPAFDKGSDSNERVIIRFKTGNEKWEMKQIAGTVARRIVTYAGPGDFLNKGERFGMIRFGSRVDIRFKMPKGHKISVRIGDRVVAGVTSLTR